MSPQAFYLGLDLGQRRDFTVLATLERLHTPHSALNICALRRFPLGTSYAVYPNYVKGYIEVLSHAAPVSLIIGAAGPGAPIVDLLRHAAPNASIAAVQLTSGQASSRATIPRRHLIANLIHLLDTNRLQWAGSLPLRGAFETELLQLRADTTHPNGTRRHDDLVIAVALAAWQAEIASTPRRRIPSLRSGRETMHRNRRGFTLIELMIAVAIIAVILAVAIPSLQASRIRANETMAVRMIHTIHTAQAQYQSETGDMAVSLSQLRKYLPPTLATGNHGGYNFVLEGTPEGYRVVASPERHGRTGVHAYVSDETLMVRDDEGHLLGGPPKRMTQRPDRRLRHLE